MDRIDIWFNDRKEQGAEKVLRSGKTVYEFHGRAQTEAYDAWESNGRAGDAPERYIGVTVSVWDEPLAKHLKAIFDKRRDDPRPAAHVTGKWGNSRQYEGRTYADFTARDASPLIWGPLAKKAAE